MLLKDKVAIVTGGGQGIGEGIVNCFAREVGNLVAFLCSDMASYMVGSAVVVDGGVMAQ